MPLTLANFVPSCVISIATLLSEILGMYCTKWGILCGQLHGMGQIDKAFELPTAMYLETDFTEVKG